MERLAAVVEAWAKRVLSGASCVFAVPENGAGPSGISRSDECVAGSVHTVSRATGQAFRMKQSGTPSAEFYVAALQCAGVGVWHIDVTSGVMTWGRVAEKILQLTPPRTVAEFLEKVLPQDRAAVADFFQPVRQPVGRETIQFRFYRRAGETRWLQCTGCSLLDDLGSGNMLGGIVRDVTIQVEDRLRLQESERRLDTLIDNLQGIAYRCEAAAPWRILFASKGVTEITGYEMAELESGGWARGGPVFPGELSRGRERGGEGKGGDFGGCRVI